jgi:endonuclease III related protein
VILSKARPIKKTHPKAEPFEALKLYQTLNEFYGPSHWWPGESPLEVMVGAVLTQNTAWTNVEKAIHAIKAHQALDLKTLYDMDDARLAALIRPSGYYNIKTRRLKNLLGAIMNHAGGDLADFFNQETIKLRQQLLEVKGIGKETADSICCYAADKPVFVVDAYTKRILLRHGWIQDPVDYDRIQQLFTSELPRDLQIYKDLHAYIVFIGKGFCKTRNPVCETCPLGPQPDNV